MLGQHWYTNVGPTWICPLAQCWHNGGIQSLAQRWPNVSMQSWANVGSTLAQLTNPCWPNVGVPTLAQHKSWRWAIVAMLAGLPGSQFNRSNHYSDVIMSAMASQITSLTIVYSTLYLGADQRNHQSSASLAFVRGNSPVTGKFPPQKASNTENVSIWWHHHGHPGGPTDFTWNKANLRDLITATGQAISLKLDSNHWFFCPYAHEIWWSQKTIGHLFCATSSFVHDFKAIGDFNLELLSGNTQFGSKLAIFACVTL